MPCFAANNYLICSFAFLGTLANSLISCPLEMLKYTMISQKHNKNSKDRAGFPVVLHEGRSQRPGLRWTEDVHTTHSVRGLFPDLKSIRCIPLPCQGDTLQPSLFNWASDSTKTPFVRTSKFPGMLPTHIFNVDSSDVSIVYYLCIFVPRKIHLKPVTKYFSPISRDPSLLDLWGIGNCYCLLTVGNSFLYIQVSTSTKTTHLSYNILGFTNLPFSFYFP